MSTSSKRISAGTDSTFIVGATVAIVRVRQLRLTREPYDRLLVQISEDEALIASVPEE